MEPLAAARGRLIPQTRRAGPPARRPRAPNGHLTPHIVAGPENLTRPRRETPAMTDLADRMAAFEAAYTSFETSFLIAFAIAAAIGALVPLLLRDRIDLSVGMLFFAACMAVPVGLMVLTGERAELRTQQTALCADATDRIHAGGSEEIARAALDIGCDQPALRLALPDAAPGRRVLMSD